MLYSVLRIGVWLSLVERFVRDEEVACSNLVTPTTRPLIIWIGGFFILLQENACDHLMTLSVFAALPNICSGHKVIDVGGMHVQFEELQSFPAEAAGGFIHVDDHRQIR